MRGQPTLLRSLALALKSSTCYLISYHEPAASGYARSGFDAGPPEHPGDQIAGKNRPIRTVPGPSLVVIERGLGGRGASPFAQAFNQSPGGGQLRFIIGGMRHVGRIAAGLESSGDLGKRLFGHREIAAPLGKNS